MVAVRIQELSIGSAGAHCYWPDQISDMQLKSRDQLEAPGSRFRPCPRDNAWMSTQTVRIIHPNRGTIWKGGHDIQCRTTIATDLREYSLMIGSAKFLFSAFIRNCSSLSESFYNAYIRSHNVVVGYVQAEPRHSKALPRVRSLSLLS